ncbi:MAG: pyridoxamine 5'-phosphate oxidase [Saprospiraceae bacterium]
MKKIKLSTIRKSYVKNTLLEDQVASDPYLQFNQWFHDYIASDPLEPTALTLATSTKDGKPSARTVLLKGYGKEQGFLFYTNYGSRKGIEIKSNPHGALLFFWPAREQQIRVEGKIKKTSKIVSEEYFQSRPRASQLSAWTSEQSTEIPNRKYLDQVLNQMEAFFKDQAMLPLPPFWGGFSLIPAYFEFWQGRPDRLHDRITYSLKRGKWVISRLAP